MKTYVCHKIVRAVQLAEYREDDRDWVLDNGNHMTVDELAARHQTDYTPVVGDYLVEYEGGYTSVSPKDAFESGYSVIDSDSTAVMVTAENPEALSFSTAVHLLKHGYKVARQGWNGKGMWLHMIPKSHWETTRGLELLDGLPWIGMKTADDKFVPWLASQTDVLAHDWVVVATPGESPDA